MRGANTVRMCLMAVILVGVATSAWAEDKASTGKSAKARTGAPSGAMSKEQLHDGMRKLWEEHIQYTRNYIISGLAGLEDAQKCAERLLRNQDDIGNAVKAFYGEPAGNKLAALLRDHILIAAEIVKAAKMNDSKAVDAGEKKWHANAEEIAAFLSGANPNWSRTTLVDMLNKHLEYTTSEVVARVKKDWTADIQAYDKGHDHMLMFADMLTEGIVKQFPTKFATLAGR